jgi:hypothetical protein
LIALVINADKVRKAHFKTDVQRHQITRATFTLPPCSQALVPFDRFTLRWQQGFKASKDRFGTLQKGIQFRIHNISSD